MTMDPTKLALEALSREGKPSGDGTHVMIHQPPKPEARAALWRKSE